jgi:hypothetical protein
MDQSFGHPYLETSPGYFLFMEHNTILCTSKMFKRDIPFFDRILVVATIVNDNPNKEITVR